jgi:hypothetical protein
MADFVFPENVFDEPLKLLTAVGSFWANSYQGAFPVGSLLHARARLEAQNHLDLLHLVASMSRLSVPVFRRQDWYLLQLRESQLNRGDAALPRFDGTYAFDGAISWGVPVQTEHDIWPAPATLTGVKMAMNRITDPSLTLTHGLDFYLDGVSSVVTFRENPFDNPLVSVREVVEDNEIVDREAALWLYAGEFDVENVYKQFGYVLGIHLKSSDGYRSLVNAVFDSLVDGGTQGSVDRVFAAVAGVPLVRKHGEVVRQILADSRDLWVITDTEAYRHHKRSTPTVAVGQTLIKGQAMTDTMRVYEFGSGQVPPEIRALHVPNGHLAAGYYAGVSFENKNVPLVVEEGVDGYTKISWEVGGFPGDVEQFWADVHSNGVERGNTLAMLMDQRPDEAKTTQPTALALPATVNPLGFLLQNVFRNNLYVVCLKPATFGSGALRLHNAVALRKVVPPHTAVLVVVELAVADDPVILDAPGDDTKPGCEERLGAFSGTSFSETLDPGDLVTERVKARQQRGQCQ